MGDVGLIDGPSRADVLADELHLVVVTGVPGARQRGLRIRSELPAVAKRERHHVLELRLEHRRERRRGRFPDSGTGRGAERIRRAVPVIRPCLEDDVADRATQCHAGVLGVAVPDAGERVRELSVERRSILREERDEHLVRGGGSSSLGVSLGVVHRRRVGLVPCLGAIDAVVLSGVHDGQDPREPERVAEGLGSRCLVPLANDLARGRPAPRRGGRRRRRCEREHGDASDDDAMRRRHATASAV